MVDDDRDPPDLRVKDLMARAADDALDPETQANLARWFGLPSFQQVDEGDVKPPPASTEDPDIVARRDAQARATAHVDPALLAAIHARGARVETMITYRPTKLAWLDPSISALDPVMLARAYAVTEPREVDMPLGLHDDLMECTPQAVLRDLHRSEEQFPIRFEVDPELAALQNVNPLAEVRAAVTTRLHPGFPATPYQQAKLALEPLARAKREPWADIRTPNRRVTE